MNNNLLINITRESTSILCCNGKIVKLQNSFVDLCFVRRIVIIMQDRAKFLTPIIGNLRFVKFRQRII